MQYELRGLLLEKLPLHPIILTFLSPCGSGADGDGRGKGGLGYSPVLKPFDSPEGEVLGGGG